MKLKRLGFIFPGQGSQKVGMGSNLYQEFDSVRALFDNCDQVLGRDLSSIILEGPQEDLTLTENAQPAIFLISAAILKLLKGKKITPTLVAGHSLGEITAYYASGVFDLETAINVIKVRGEGMGASVAPGESGMAAVMGLDEEQIDAVIAAYSDAPLVIANYNCPGQIVISGQKAALESSYAGLKEAGGKVIPLPVSGAFHSPLMQHGSDQLRRYLADVEFNIPELPIVLNRSAESQDEVDKLKTNLPQQVISSVRWIESIRHMASRVDMLVEVGPGRVLSGLAKKIVPDFPIKTVSNLEQLNEFVEEIGGK